MSKWLFRSAFALSLGCVSIAPVSVVADTTVAIILEVTGDREPEVDAYTQLEHKSVITLGPGALLRFNHRGTCRRVTVVGEGTLTVRRGSYRFTGQTSEEVEAICQNPIVYVDPDMESAGLTTRGTRTSIVLHTGKPHLIVSGYDTAHFYKVEFQAIDPKDDAGKTPGVTASADIAGPVTRWPESEAPLESGSTYKVILVKDGKISKSAGTIRIDYLAQPLASQHFLLFDYGDAVLK